MKAIVLGGGPAGISAAIYLARGKVETTVIRKDLGALAKADLVENYYGFAEPISGKKIVDDGIEQAKRLGVKIIDDEVVGLTFESSLVVLTKDKKYEADGVVIATGASRLTPNIKGLAGRDGKGVSYCAVCDAFFYKGKDVAVLGEGEYALHEALELVHIANSVTVLTNGKAPTTDFPENIRVVTDEISQVVGESNVESVEFTDGGKIDVSGIFIAVGVAGSSALAKKIGAITEKNSIVVDDNMQTNIPGLYAAGDCTSGMLQVAKAVYEGAKAGTELMKYLRQNKK